MGYVIKQRVRVSILRKVLDSPNSVTIKCDFRFHFFDFSLELRNNIELLKNNQLKEIKTMIDLGSHFYVKAKVSALLLMKRERQRTSQIFNLLNCRFDTSRIYVHVGLGFHVEFTLDEALKFIDVKEKHINIYIEELTKKINKIRAQINYMYQGIKELKQM